MSRAPIELIKDPQIAFEVCKLLLDAPNVAISIEATGTDPHSDKIILLTLASRKHNRIYIVDTRNPQCLTALSGLFATNKVIKTAYQASLVYQMIKGTIGIDTENMICIQLGERAITVGLSSDKITIEGMTEKYLGTKPNRAIQDSFVSHMGEFTEEQLEYSAVKTWNILEIGSRVQEQAKSMGSLKIWKIECDAIQSFADMEFYGQKIDESKWKQIMRKNSDLAKEAKGNLDRFFAPVCERLLDLEEETGEICLDINYNSAPMVLNKLQKLGISIDGKPIANTNKTTQKIFGDHPIFKALSQFRSATKCYATFGENFLKAIHPKTGRIHFKFNQYGTDTGRPSSYGGLNCLNIPKDPTYRDCFTTEPGRLLSVVDYSQAEIRIIADLSGDPLMIRGFHSNVDFHCFVASMLFNKEVNKKGLNSNLRIPAKEINFGLAYGLGVKALWRKLNSLGYDISFDDCNKLYNKYMNTFVVANKWLRSQRTKASTYFQRTNINGRRRHWERVEDKSSLSNIEREGANFSIQSVNADFTKIAMAQCRRKFKEKGWDARTYNSIYDEIIYDFHESYAEDAHRLQKQIMLDSANEILSRVKMEVEGHLGFSWRL